MGYVLRAAAAAMSGTARIRIISRFAVRHKGTDDSRRYITKSLLARSSARMTGGEQNPAIYHVSSPGDLGRKRATVALKKLAPINHPSQPTSNRVNPTFFRFS